MRTVILNKDIEPLLKSLYESLYDGFPTHFICRLTNGKYDANLENLLKKQIAKFCGRLTKAFIQGKSLGFTLRTAPIEHMLEAYIVELYVPYLGAFYDGKVMPDYYNFFKKHSLKLSKLDFYDFHNNDKPRNIGKNSQTMRI